MSQQEINEEIYDILLCLIHSTDHCERGVVDLNADAFRKRLRKLLDTSTQSIKGDNEK